MERTALLKIAPMGELWNQVKDESRSLVLWVVVIPHK